MRGRRMRIFSARRICARASSGLTGFFPSERFASLTTEGRILSLSMWRDEAAIARWRADDAHRAAQAAGRAHIFADYRLRVARVVRDYSAAQREAAPSG